MVKPLGRSKGDIDSDFSMVWRSEKTIWSSFEAPDRRSVCLKSAARKSAIKGNKGAAERYAANVLPVIREIQASGVKSLRGVARALSARGIATARGGEWSPVQVSDILRRAR